MKKLIDNKMHIFTKQKNMVWLCLVLLVVTMTGQRAFGQCAAPPVGCSNTDLTNYGFNSTNNAATIEYDNFISGYHQTMVRTSDGSFKVWGQSIGSSGAVYGTYGSGTHILSPQVLNSTNYPGLTGTPLKVALGGDTYAQQVVLTTTGLFAWGFTNSLLATSLTTSTTFQKITVNGKADGLPAGVSPGDVKMLYGTAQTLVITTCSGNVWVLAVDASARGNGGTGSADVWSQVTTTAAGNPALTNVVAARGSRMGLMALKSDGTIWTWGAKSLDGTGSTFTDRNRAVQMTLPAGITVKMIGATSKSSFAYFDPSATSTDPSFYVLATNGNLYSMGNNGVGQLGNWTTTNSLVWTQPRYTSAAGPVMNNIKWMSPNEHDCFIPGMNVISTTGALTGWSDTTIGGYPNGFAGTNTNDPATPNGIAPTEVIFAVETGGHTSMIAKQCNPNFGYVGHRVNGSMGDGTDSFVIESSYTFATAPVQICGAETAKISIAQTPTGPTGKYCVGSVIPITAVTAGGILSATGPGTLSGNNLTVTGAGTITLVYNLTTVCGTPLIATLDVATEVCCAAGSTAPTLSATTASNICPATTVNLNSLVSSSPPSGASLVWFTNNAHTGTAYATPTAAIAGTYYAFYFDATNNCYSPASAAVTFNAVICSNPTLACSTPLVGCSTTNLSNFGFKSDNNASTIEYDNFISGFHQTMVRASDGSFKVWGQSMGSSGAVVGTYASGTHILSPQVLNSTNYPGLTGTPLKVAMGGEVFSQQVVLTTTGLFAWGYSNSLLATSLTPSTTFQQITVNGKADGLPAGVTPADVKMLYGTAQTLVLTTCSGNVWVLAVDASARGNGGTGSATVWSQVTTTAAGNPALTNVVAARGSRMGLMALKSDGTVWTWGAKSLDGTGSTFTDRNRAVQMTLPAGITVKMIGATSYSNNFAADASTTVTDPSFYVLATNGNLYAMGTNNVGQLGDWTTTNRLVWTQPRYTSAAGPVMNNIKWMSPTEHDCYAPGMNVISTTGALTAWSYVQTGGGTTGFTGTASSNDPATPAGIGASDVILAVETGGHTSMIAKQCEPNFGYVGHFTDGSAGNGSNVNSSFAAYTFATSPVQICGAETASISISQAPTGPTGKYCVGSVIPVMTTPVGGILSATGPGTLSGSNLTVTGAGTITLVYNLTSVCGTPLVATLDVATEVCCAAGTTAPTLSAITKANVCPDNTVNLTSITASNLPASTTLTWHTGTPATTANKITGTAVASGIYYAAFFDATNNCYSPATTAVTVSVITCPVGDNDNDTVPDLTDLDDDNDGILDTDEYGNCISGVKLPKFFEDFGTGGPVSSAYVSSTYTFSTTPDIGANQYAIVANARTIHSLFVDGPDHSTPNGRMLVVNASATPGEFYRRTVPVTPNAPLQFDFWVKEAYFGGSGNISAQLEPGGGGTLIGSVSTGSFVSDGAWHNYVINVNPGNNSSVDIILRNNYPTSSGNDLLIDDIRISQIFCDTDNDNIPNYVDTDSDNDGCTDANEYYNSPTASGTDGGAYGTGNPAVNINGTVIAASYSGTYTNVIDNAVSIACLLPIASNDVDTYSANTPKIISVLSNDVTGDVVVATTVSIVGGSNPDAAGEFLTKVVAGEGTWTVNSTTGTITFTPLSGYIGNPTPIQYTVKDAQGSTSNAATVTLTSTCQAGTIAPTLSAITKANICPATTVDLTSITASNLPASTTLTWHTGTPATTANKIAGTGLAAGTYYAAFFDATNNCYSSATTAVTATVSTCTAPICTVTPTIIKN